MMAKIVAALGKTDATAPLATMPPMPQARAYAVLGGLALRKFFPGAKGVPGQWFKAPGGEDVFITYSPEYILRFREVTPAVRQMKLDMWNGLKELRRKTEA